jgi:hypothetical protein
MIRLRIVRPLPPAIDGFDLSHLRFGAAYDIQSPLCDVLLVSGYGVPVDESSALARAVADERAPRMLRQPAARPGKRKQSSRRRTGSMKR